MAVVTAASLAAAGCAFAWLVLRGHGLRRRRLLLYSLGFGPGAGFGLAAFQLFFSRFLGLSRPGLGAFVVSAAVIGALLVLRGRLAPPAATVTGRGASGMHLPLGVTVLAFLALAASSVSMVTAYQRMQRAWPDGMWDAVAIHNVRARLFYARYDDFPSTLAQVSPGSHPHYPLLVPGAVAAQKSLLGIDHRTVPRLTALFFVLGLGALLFAILADKVALGAAAAATAVIWGIPAVWTVGFGQLADIPAAYYFLGSVAVAASHLPDRDGPTLPPLIGGFFTSCLVWTKNEGVLLAGLIVLVFSLSWLAARRSDAWRLSKEARVAGVWFLASALPGFVALWLLKNYWAPESGLSVFFSAGWKARIMEAERWWTSIQQVGVRIMAIDSTHGWSFVWPVTLLGLVAGTSLTRGRGTPWVRFWRIVAAAALACWIFIYVMTPYDQMWHIRTSMDRLLLQIYPVVLVGTFASLRAASRIDRVHS